MPQNDETGQGFFRIPRALFTEKYAGLRADAKLLYGMLLDRLCLSKKNNWMDANGRTYVYFSGKEIMRTFECQPGKADAMLKGLRNFGLIETKRQPNKAMRIYVREFVLISQPDGEEKDVPPADDDFPESPPSYDSGRKYENRNTENSETTPPHGAMPQNGIAENGTPGADSPSNVVRFPQSIPQSGPPAPDAESGIAKTGGWNCDFQPPELRKSQSSYTESIYPEYRETYHPPLVPTGEGGPDGPDIRQTVHENIEYDILREKHADDLPRLESVVSRLVEALRSGRPTLRVNGENLPAEEVKARLLTLTDGHIDYAIDVLSDPDTHITSIRPFLLTLLYNAPSQMDVWYDNKVRRDAERAAQAQEPVYASL